MTKRGADDGSSPPSQPLPPNDRNAHLDADRIRTGLRVRAVRSGFIVVGARGIQIVLNVGAVAVLARLLTPADFGVMAMVIPIALVVNLTTNLGLSTAILHEEQLEPGQLSSAFWVSQRVNVVLMVAMAAMGPLLARFYGEPRVTAVAAIWAASIFIRNLTAFHEGLLKRQMLFGTAMGIHLGAMFVGVVVAIVSALLGVGHFALILQILAWDVTRVVAGWIVCPWRPSAPGRSLANSDARVRQLVSYGAHLCGFRAIHWIGQNVDRVVVGYVGGAGVLGLYHNGRRWAWYPFSQLFQSLSDVAVSAWSRVHEDADRFRAYCRLGLLPIFALPMPLLAFLFLEAHDVLVTLLGDQWLDAVPFFRLMCVAAFVGSLGRVTDWLYMSQGNTERQLRWGLVQTPTMIAGVVLGARWGAIGVAWGFTLATALLVYPTLAYCLRGSSLRLRDVGGIVWRPIVASLGAAAAFTVLPSGWLEPRLVIVELLLKMAAFLPLYTLFWLGLPGGAAATRELVASLSGAWARPEDELDSATGEPAK